MSNKLFSSTLVEMNVKSVDFHLWDENECCFLWLIVDRFKNPSRLVNFPSVPIRRMRLINVYNYIFSR